MQIRAITNQKGGVGKTTTSANLGAALAERGLRVLLIDLDPQGNLSTHVGVDIYELERSVYDVLVGGAPLASIIRPTGIPGLFCAPSNIDLSGAEIEMVSAVGRETILKEALADHLANAPEAERFDYALIDCPPSLGLLCINALAAADELIIPMQTEFFALQGMSKLMEVVEIVRKRLNPSLRVGGIVACRMDTRTRLSTEVLADIKRYFPDLLFETRIRQNVKLAEAPSFGQTIIEYAPDSNGAEDYRYLAMEFLGEALPVEDEDEEEDVEEDDVEEVQLAEESDAEEDESDAVQADPAQADPAQADAEVEETRAERDAEGAPRGPTESIGLAGTSIAPPPPSVQPIHIRDDAPDAQPPIASEEADGGDQATAETRAERDRPPVALLPPAPAARAREAY